MDIKLLPAGSKCLVDANILLYHIAGSSSECKDFLRRVAKNEIEGQVTTVIIAEVLHRQMLIEAVGKGLITPSKALKKLKDDPTIIPKLSDYVTQVEKLLKLPLAVIEIRAADIARSHAIRRDYGLFVNDSINVAAAERFGITDVVTHDGDFKRVPSMTTWDPSDI